MTLEKTQHITPLPSSIPESEGSGVIFRLIPSALLVLCLFITWLSWLSSIASEKQNQQDYFDFRVREAIGHITSRMQAYEQVLHGARGLYEASTSVERNEFRSYVTAQNLADNYPGIQGVGFSLIVPVAEKTKHLSKIRQQGFPEYSIRPEGARELYTSIVYLEPFSGMNLRAFGYDMYSETVRRAAMEMARDNDAASVSGKVRLVQESGKHEQAGFLMYLPVYKNGLPHSTLIERQANIIAWVYAPFRMNDLMAGLQGERVGDLDIEIFDGKDVSANTLMFDSDNSIAEKSLLSPELSSSNLVEIAGHTWTINISPLPGMYSPIESKRPVYILVAGIVISMLMVWLAWLLVNGRQRAIHAARKMNLDLIESESQSRDQSRRLAEVIWATDIGTWEWNVQTGETIFNDRWAEIVGYTLAELAPISIDTWSKLVHPDDEKFSGKLLTQCFDRESESYTCETRMRHKNGDWIWVLDRGRVIEWTADGTPLRMSGTHQDITERKRLDKLLRDERDFLNGVLDTAKSLVMVIKRDGSVARINQAAQEFTGYTFDEIKSRPFFWERFLLPAQRSHVQEVFSKTIAGNIVHRYENYWVRKDGSKRLFDWSNSLLLNSDGEIEYLVTVGIDITESKQLAIKLEQQAHEDYLTGTSNRRYFMELAEQELNRASRYDNQLSIFMMDIDFFKRINDTYGHKAGDQVLKKLAEVCRETLREVDILGRVGGEEFAILLPETDRDESIEVAERLRAALAEAKVQLEADGLAIQFTVSIGVASLVSKNNTLDLLLNLADKALYKAKESGRNKICVAE